MGETVTLTGDEARHARKAQRLRPGEAVDLVDGAGLRVRGVVAADSLQEGERGGGSALRVQVEQVLQEPVPRPALVLVQARAKGGRDERAVEMATEVGVDEVVPWEAARSVVRWKGAKVEAGEQRWRRVALAAAKQARRSRVPTVHPVVNSHGLTRLVETWTSEGDLVLVCHESATTALSKTLGQVKSGLQQSRRVVVIIGPEGGISDEELTDLEGAGAKTVRLGDTVMRTSTAGPVALVATNLSLNRW